MSTIFVTTQKELDAALKEHGDDWRTEIVIKSERGVWLEVRAYDSATVSAYGSATVSAYDSATVSAYDSATVSAYGSATVRAYDSATVSAYGSATVSAYGSATVSAYGSATVSAYGSATVSAYDSATVSAYGSATVSAYDSATVSAGTYVAVHLHSASVTLEGGAVIDLREVDLHDVDTWIGYTGAEVDDEGRVLLYKAVDDELVAGHGYIRTEYPVGTTVEATDWADDNDCGGGLHACPHPHQSLHYNSGPRMLLVAVDKADLRPIKGGTAKAKARRFHVLREVTQEGGELK